MRTLRKILENLRDATRALGHQRRITILSLLILGLGLATAVSSIASGRFPLDLTL
jgi:hypothetical protein